ncbi:hypothetical protein Syun_010535 [Stephania yunnanensis]|uniref:UDP-glycosyltransferases domain-containing protein n=1 Tax=Stephania yunnanensis TaxID=152371 RepID=A0AAP0KGM6_9MAGN
MRESTAKKYELVFIPGAGISHLVPTVEFAKTLLDTDHRFSVTVLTMNVPFGPIQPSYTDSFPQIRFIELVRPDSPSPEMKHSLSGICEFIDHYKPHSRQAITQLIATELDPNSVSLAALVLDMFTTTMVDIADELGVPSYVYYTSGAATLDLFLYMPILDSTYETDLKDDLTRELEIPSFKNSVKEIANGLERSGHRFLWSVRPKDGSTRLDELVPEGFVERTAERGMVCGWVPQVAVLGHGSVKCFVSHCGWNSTLESFWFGVPILTWPLYAEQHLNAFSLVKELRLSVELKGYYRVSEDDLVTAEEVERGVRKVMEGECEEVRKRVEEMKEKSRRALKEGGSSAGSVKRLIEDLVQGR